MTQHPLSESGMTLYDKIWQDHVVKQLDDGTDLLYIDRHLVHEVTSPLAFDSMRKQNRSVRRKEFTLAVVEHNIPTWDRSLPVTDKDSAEQMAALDNNTREFGLTYFNALDKRQGIVHVIGPEQGFILPGTTVVCGDSHTSTNGAFGALAHGIGSSEVEHVLTTQTLPQSKAKNLKVEVSGKLAPGVTAKDTILQIIATLGAAGGSGYVIEYTGQVIRDMTMEQRMTLCNMAIEAGAKAGLVAPDETTFAYLKGRPMAPTGELWEQALAYWKTLPSDPHAHFDKVVTIRGDEIEPMVTWGTSPEDVVTVSGVVPQPESYADANKRAAVQRSLEYMDLQPGQAMGDIAVSHVFIGSCTNARMEDLRAAAELAKGNKVAEGVAAMIVPGSGLIKQQAEQEGVAQIFKDAGFDWREPGCSMCLGMNPDRLSPGDRCASTSNRNFEGRQGRGARTHLVSPVMAVAAAIAGKITDCRALAAKV